MRSAAVLTGIVLLWATPLAAADVAEGRKIANAWCGSCHLTSEGKGGTDTAPQFATIARNRNLNRDTLAGVLAKPHPAMPRLDLSRSQIDDLVAYIRSLHPDGTSAK